MADESVGNVLSNGNEETSPSTGNEFLYFTAESDILNVSNDSVNQSLFMSQNENIDRSMLSSDIMKITEILGNFNINESSFDANCNTVDMNEILQQPGINPLIDESRKSIQEESQPDVTLKDEAEERKGNVSVSEIDGNEPAAPTEASNPVIEKINQFRGDLSVGEALQSIEESPVLKTGIQSTFESSTVAEKLSSPSLSGSMLSDQTLSFMAGGDSSNEISRSLPNKSLDVSNDITALTPDVDKHPTPEVDFSSPSTNAVSKDVSTNDECIFKVPAVPVKAADLVATSPVTLIKDTEGDIFNACEKLVNPKLPSMDVSTNNDSSFKVPAIPVDATEPVATSPVTLIKDTEGDIIFNASEKLSFEANSELPSKDISANKDSIFKVPAIPVKAADLVASSPVTLIKDTEGGIFNASEKLNFEANPELPSGNLSTSHSGSTNDKNYLFNSQEPCRSSEVESVPFLELPEPRVFTDLGAEKNDVEDNPFEVPEPPKDDEEFTDAVQFFKDPSSFQYLENIETSVPADSIPRSSLYVAFDPLHSKRVSVSQLLSTPAVLSIPESEVDNNSTPVKKHLVNASLRESLGVLISFDSPKPKALPEEKELPVEVPMKQYTEEELQQILKINELTMQETYLKKHKELEEELAKAGEESKEKINQLSTLNKLFSTCMEEMAGVVQDLKIRNEELVKLNVKLEDDVRTAGEDLQSVESTFSDFHKRYEQCKGMLKTYKENEAQLKAKISDLEQKYNTLQEQSHEALEKANMEAVVAKKSSEGQVTVLKAQLKKAELKISSLESDLSQVKIENSKLGGICDDLMAKVSEG